MVLSRKLRDIVLCLSLLAVPILFLQAGLKKDDELNPFDQVLLRISAPLQAGITAAISGVHRGWRRYVYLVGVEKQNEQLKKENSRLKVVEEGVRRDRDRLRLYEKLLGFRKSKGVETIGARVIGRDSSPFVRAVRIHIDRGKPALRQGMPVVTAKGVVGRVGRVYGSYSDVVLAVDPKSAVDVIIQRTGGRGLLRGIVGANRYICRIDYLLRKESVNVGDLVVTSGVAGVFPKDLHVGRISKVTKRTYGLYQEVEVTPSVDFSSLEDMLVILSPAPPAAPKSKGRQPARGYMP